MKLLNTIASLCVLMALSSCTNEDSEPKQKDKLTPLLTTSNLKTINKSFKHSQPLTESFEIHEALGSGLAVIDIDNDGIYEVLFAQFEKNHTSSVLYQWVHGQFKDITAETGLSGFVGIMGVATADINNDGWNDVLLYGLKQLHLMINIKGHFEEFKLPPLPNNSFYSSATFFNADNDDFLDLWLSRYVDSSLDKTCKGNDGLRMYCSPSAYPFQPDILLINNHGTSFQQAPKTLISIPASPSLEVVAADFNHDKLQDVFVANDGENNYLFTQQVDGSFIEQAEIKSLGSNLAGLKEASMGIAVGDYDNNGLQDLFLTHLGQETNTLYKNEKDWFVDVTNQSGLGATSRNQTGFGTGFYDLNGDNWLDLLVANGRIQPKPYKQRKNLTQQFNEKPLLFLNHNGYFELEKIFDEFKFVGRGLVFIDIDSDGDKDIISNNNNQSPSIFTNNLNPKLWYGLQVKCHNRTDIGAEIQFTVQHLGKEQVFYRTIHTDGSYASASDPRILIYLSTDETLETIQIQFSNQIQKEYKQQMVKNIYNTVDC
jgi:hypothetical protein